MLDFTRVDPRLFDDVGLVVDALVVAASVESERIMLVGAQCRDILHQALGHTSANRATGDLDFGLALSGWEAFERVDRAFDRVGDTGIRYRVCDVLVDVMPFGAAIEDPSGVVNPNSRGEEIVVFGFEDVFERALQIDLPDSEYEIKIPSPAGYAALKLRAWVDRSAYGEFKDAEDLATVLSWYEGSGAVQDRIYGESIQIADRYAYDIPLVCAHLLGQDVRRQLKTVDADDLARRLAQSDAQRFTSALNGEPWNPVRGVDVTNALQAGLAPGASSTA